MWAVDDVHMEDSQMSVAGDSSHAFDKQIDEESMLSSAYGTPTCSLDSKNKSSEQSLAMNDIDEDFFAENEVIDESQQIGEFISIFNKLARSNQRLALTALVESSAMPHIRHLRQLIEPHFQRDFLSFLPIELADIILKSLDPKDFLVVARVSHNWRMISEDEHYWKSRCEELSLSQHLPAPTSRVDGAWGSAEEMPGVLLHDHLAYDPWCKFREQKLDYQFGSIYYRSFYKSLYMRKERIIANWRKKQIRGSCVLRGHDDHVITCMHIHGDILVTGSDDNTLRVWSIDQGICRFTLTGHTGGVWTSHITSDGRYIVSGSTDRTIKVWSTADGSLRYTLSGHTSTVRCMSMYGSILVTGSRDTTLRVWDIEEGSCVRVLSGHLAAVRCVQFDGEVVVSGGYDFTVKVWSAANGTCERTLQGHSNRVYSLLYDSDRRLVISGSLDTSIRVWDMTRREGEECTVVLTGHTSLTSGMQLRGDILVSCNADSHVRVWNIKTGTCIFLLTGPNGHTSAITSLQFFDDDVVATSSDDGTVKLWDIKKGTFIRNLVLLQSGGNGGCIWRLCATPTLLACAIGSRNNTEETKIICLDFDADFP
ncbi:unnamed protein product [Caenorhabditis auriculariae]|uniref:F-box domain-containing protein n=1 Tax=Caenorhabditis auriculariae TaxID=2777116 RepID=A0A8S1HM92_9PELO|nr:unnamed protein product [Caenorhabditis auriculariae]